jgi:hypothetical protein
MRKHPLTTPVWADAIRVERKGESLIITGINHSSTPLAGVAVTADLLAQSLPPDSGPGNRRKKPPHVEFANATDDDKLMEFCKRWGPFDGSVTGMFSAPDSPRGWKLAVTETLPRLRAGQRGFTGVTRLIAEIQSEEPNPERFSQYHAQVSALGEQEVFFDLARFQNPGVQLAKAASQFAQTLVCRFLDEYPPHLLPTTEGPIELPPMDPSFIGKGIKHVLYGFLRLEYLRTDRRGLGVCPKCDEVFAKERAGAVFCCEECSKLRRSLEYYREVGRSKRQEKAVSSKSRPSHDALSKRIRT